MAESAERKAQRKRYLKSAKGKAVRDKWMKSVKGKTYRQRVAKTPARKRTTRQAQWRLHGIDMDYSRYLVLVEECHNKCPFCTTEQNEERIKAERDLVVDHDHTTGIVRGLLCGRHNLALGHFDKLIPELLYYLKGNHEKTTPTECESTCRADRSSLSQDASNGCSI